MMIRCGSDLLGQGDFLFAEKVAFNHKLCTTKSYLSLLTAYKWSCKDRTVPVPATDACPGDPPAPAPGTTAGPGGETTAGPGGETTAAPVPTTGAAEATTAAVTTAAATTAAATTAG